MPTLLSLRDDGSGGAVNVILERYRRMATMVMIIA